MDYSPVKLIASDMDGTLLSPEGTLDPEFFTLYDKLHARGIHFAAASGRQYYNLLEKFHPIREQITFISENGAYVVHRGEELSVITLTPDQAVRIIREVRLMPNVYLILCGKRQAYIEDTNPSFVVQARKYYERCEVVTDLLDVKDDPFLKLAIYAFDGVRENAYPRLRSFENELRVVVSGQNWLDISAFGADKGTAIELVQSKLNITSQQTMSFGDQMNDVEMLQQSGYSYAVANAVEKVKDVSRYQAPSNNENGVIQILQKVAASQTN